MPLELRKCARKLKIIPGVSARSYFSGTLDEKCFPLHNGDMKRILITQPNSEGSDLYFCNKRKVKNISNDQELIQSDPTSCQSYFFGTLLSICARAFNELNAVLKKC